MEHPIHSHRLQRAQGRNQPQMYTLSLSLSLSLSVFLSLPPSLLQPFHQVTFSALSLPLLVQWYIPHTSDIYELISHNSAPCRRPGHLVHSSSQVEEPDTQHTYAYYETDIRKGLDRNSDTTSLAPPTIPLYAAQVADA